MANAPKQYTKMVTQTGKGPSTNGWRERHLEAIEQPRPGFERAVVRMLRGWLEYAEVHEQRYETPIGNDGVLGLEWEAIGDALRGLLNGETGRLDCGSLDGLLLDAMREAGINTENK